jgi:hypothetical protein
MAEIKELVPWLHENKIRLDVVYIRSEANLADAPSRQRGLDMWSFQQPTQQELMHLVESTLGSQVCTDPFACKQSAVARCGSKILHTSALSSQLSLQRFAPRLVTARYTVAKSAMASTEEVQRLSAFHFRQPRPRLCVRSHHPGIVEPFVNREVQLRAVVFDCA